MSVPTIELQIHDVAFGGKGVARDDGKAVFVPCSIDGERVTARIVREKKHFAEAELKGVLQPSPHRVEPRCPYFGRCGGCAYQHIDYAHQLTLKARQTEQALRRIGRLVDIPMRPIVSSPLTYEYRTRITVHARDGVLGFYRRDAHELMDIARCPIARPEVNDELAHLRERRVRDGHFTLRANVGPRVFEQTNEAVADTLTALVTSFFSTREPLLIDAFCGAGFFGRRLAHNFERIIGIDWDRFAIKAAQQGASAHETYIAGDVDRELPRIIEANRATETAILVDPPSNGLNPQTRRALQDDPPRTLVYVSCNPSTMARDLGELRATFTIESVTPLDMFPQTAEIEAVAHLLRSSM